MTSLALLQMVSPALPVGAFSYSEGLEVLIQSGALRDEHGIELWLAAELQRGGLRLEAAALPELAADLRQWQVSADASARTRAIDLDGWLLATREAAELRAQQRQMGGCLSCSQRWVTPCQKCFLWLGLLHGLGHPLLCRSLSGRWLRAISMAGLPINSVLLSV